MSLDLKEEIAFLLCVWLAEAVQEHGDANALRRPAYLAAAGLILDYLGGQGLPVADTDSVERWLEQLPPAA